MEDKNKILENICDNCGNEMYIEKNLLFLNTDEIGKFYKMKKDQLRIVKSQLDVNSPEGSLNKPMWRQREKELEKHIGVLDELIKRIKNQQIKHSVSSPNIHQYLKGDRRDSNHTAPVPVK